MSIHVIVAGVETSFEATDYRITEIGVLRLFDPRSRHLSETVWIEFGPGAWTSVRKDIPTPEAQKITDALAAGRRI